jgi:hypothetical protein
LTYQILADGGRTASNAGNFQLQDYYLQYRFADALQIRGGAYLVPFTHVEYYSAGLQLIDFSPITTPFDPVRALGVSVLGDIIKDQLAYELNLNDGSKSNDNGRSDDNSATGADDNRWGVYGRLQFAGSGKISDFNDECDLRDNQDEFAWLLEGAAGVESQNPNATAYPAAQKSLVINGLYVNQNSAYMAPYAVNGNIYRGTVDWMAKWRGFGGQIAGFYQEINDTGGAGDAFNTTYGKSSLGQGGYYLQGGYFLIPKKLEAVVRYGQLFTEGAHDHMDEYAAGLNYYLYGSKVKLQTDITYIPDAAAYTDTGVNTVANTADFIYRVQVQVKF